MTRKIIGSMVMLNNVEVFENLLSEGEIAGLRLWVIRNQSEFVPNAKGRHRKMLSFRINGSIPGIHEVQKKIKSVIPHDNLIPSSELGDNGHMFGFITDGGEVESHLDPKHDGYVTTRINTFLSLPESGGMPIVDGETYQVKKGSTLLFYPSEVEHWSEIVVGDTPRIIISFSYVFKENKSLVT